jgi:hypothetical protein
MGTKVAAAQESQFTLEGKVTEATQGKLTVSTDQNIIFHVIYTEKTVIKGKEGAVLKAADLKPGVTVHVEGELADSGEIQARTIEILESQTR